VVDMPLNSIPPTTTVPHLEAKRKAAAGQCWSDVAFWGGVIPGNQVASLCPDLPILCRHLVARPQAIAGGRCEGIQVLFD
jgi:dihydroorotase-like cyclic amidohydrolase